MAETDPRDRIPELAQDIDMLRERYRQAATAKVNMEAVATLLTAIAQAEVALSAIVMQNASDDDDDDDEPVMI